MSAVILQTDVEAIAPELVGLLTAGQWVFILANAVAQVNVGSFPSQAKANIAATYLAAHLATLSKPRGASGGTLQSVSVGGVSKTFVSTTGTGAQGLQSTGYGREYMRLCSLWCARMAVT